MDDLVKDAERYLTLCLYALSKRERQAFTVALCENRDDLVDSDPNHAAVWNALATLISEVGNSEERTLNALSRDPNQAEWIA